MVAGYDALLRMDRRGGVGIPAIGSEVSPMRRRVATHDDQIRPPRRPRLDRYQRYGGSSR